ncbi:antibiotic biosynthesis monooxygenase [Hymenobacter sp. RP-2-7]|uniref:Antibiotic biosynthesis monooxygenase n=1 Tax=Hymenobacter polaris TaxID=2682546 RepID=A0A7Y0AEU7_9BACT|nr:putative quinol monooxygenase [Hymenobacter polaris]NML65882.1 antibiotic biosynthesis monooxygenase [Hymenobacter polaris]
MKGLRNMLLSGHLGCGRWLLPVLGTGLLVLAMQQSAVAQVPASTQVVRLAKLEIYPNQVEGYKAALREGVETAMRVEPGVLTLYAVQEKANPTRFTLLEIYASPAAYQGHIQTPHFLKYKTGTKDMVKSLELIDTVPLVPGMRIK